MKSCCGSILISSSRITNLIFQVIIHVVLIGAVFPGTLAGLEDFKGSWPSFDCPQWLGQKTTGLEQEQTDTAAAISSHLPDKDIDIIVTYSDISGDVRIRSVRSKDLSASWVWKDPIDDHTQSFKPFARPLQFETRFEVSDDHQTNESSSGDEIQQFVLFPVHPLKIKRQKLRQERKERRTLELIQQGKEVDSEMNAAAVERARGLDTTVMGRYSIWRKEYENPNSDSTLKLMRDQIIMAKAYAKIAKAKNYNSLYDSLLEQSRKSHHAIGDANSDAELLPCALDRAKEMGHMLSLAKDQLYDCIEVARTLRTMVQMTETNIREKKKKSAFLTQLAAKTVPRPLHCLPLVLATDYLLQGYENKAFPNSEKLEDTSLYHYAIFSDNVLATSVVINSTVLNAKEPEKHVFHIVTDKLNFVSMRMWFLVNPPASAAIEVKNVDEFTWLNSSYCTVLRQLESARMREYYFNAHQASSTTSGSDNLKYRNPKYLSMLNHLRFYLPEVYPKLQKILFLDDDIVVQKDLTPLWSVDLQGMVNGAIETCKESFHRLDKYLNFSNPKISQNFDPNACGWAFGMNMFDLKEWRLRNITGIYHRWQDMNEDRTLWKLGTLPPGLLTFYNLTYPLDRSWHVLGLGYDPALNQTAIQNAGVVHYNGNYKPWLDLAIDKYRSYWSKYVMFDNPYLKLCNIGS
ncbi:putative galacturonosyltransferase 3 [Apium graveolens]|uniref:putative galacturonosyltransferase 3 n=1 Tax=Apium graveolens TaxID=4045 RepID=UPI003D7C0CFB